MSVTWSLVRAIFEGTQKQEEVSTLNKRTTSTLALERFPFCQSFQETVLSFPQKSYLQIHFRFKDSRFW